MNHHIHTLLKLLACCLLCCPVRAQESGLPDVAGKKENYSGREGGPNMLNNSGLDAATLNAMKAKLQAVTDVAERCPAFGSPRGFNLRVQLSADKPPTYRYPLQNALTGMSWMAMHELYKADGRIQENPETGAGVTIKVNALFDLFPNQFDNDCDDLSLPRFFGAKGFVVKDSTAQYLVLGDGRRVVTNGRPLLIPFTREQYLLFQLKGKEKQLDNQKQSLADAKAMKERASTAPDGHKVTQADKNNDKYNYILAMYESADQTIDAWRKAVEKTQAEQAALNSLLKNMTPAEKHRQAYINDNISPDNKDASAFMQLTEAGDPNGEALVTPNPAYFSKGLPATGLQLIVVAKDFDSRFVAKPYEQIIDGVLHCIDYKALKSMIQY